MSYWDQYTTHIEWIIHLVFCKLAEKNINTKFFFIFGLSITVVIPTTSSSFLSLILEYKRMWGVLNTLLDKITVRVQDSGL